MAKHLKVENEVHAKLEQFGRLGETFSDAIERAVDEARAASEDGADTASEPLATDGGRRS